MLAIIWVWLYKKKNTQPEPCQIMDISLPYDQMHMLLPQQRDASLLGHETRDPTSVPLNPEGRLNYGVEDELDEDVIYTNANASKMEPTTML